MNIHYNKTSGEIISWDRSEHADEHGMESHLPGCAVLGLAELFDVHPKTHHVNLATLKVVEKTEEEKRIADLPTVYEVKGLILNELVNTDALAAPPADRPMPDGAAEAWVEYRAMLRSASKQATPSDMVEVCPKRPEGGDAFASLRERILR